MVTQKKGNYIISNMSLWYSYHMNIRDFEAASADPFSAHCLLQLRNKGEAADTTPTWRHLEWRRPEGRPMAQWELFEPSRGSTPSCSAPCQHLLLTFDFKIKMTHNMIAALSHKSWRLWIIYLYVLKSLQVGVWYRSLPEGNIFI